MHWFMIVKESSSSAQKAPPELKPSDPKSTLRGTTTRQLGSLVPLSETVWACGGEEMSNVVLAEKEPVPPAEKPT